MKFRSSQCVGEFLELYRLSKPQNLSFPLDYLLNHKWLNVEMQLQLIEYVILNSDHDEIPLDKFGRRIQQVPEIQGLKPNQLRMLGVWGNIDLVECLIEISDSSYYRRVRALFNAPIELIPEYLILVISHTNPLHGNFLLDDL